MHNKTYLSFDSLLTLLKADNPDTNKLGHLNDLSREYDQVGASNDALRYANDAISLSLKIRKGCTDPKTNHSLQKNEALSHNTIGLINYTQGNFPEALKNHLASLKIKKELGDKKGVASSLNNIGNVYTALGNLASILIGL